MRGQNAPPSGDYCLPVYLSKRGHYRDEQLAFAVEGVDVFFLKIDLGAVLFEFSNGGEAVNGVACKTADGFSDDQPPLHKGSPHADVFIT